MLSRQTEVEEYECQYVEGQHGVHYIWQAFSQILDDKVIERAVRIVSEAGSGYPSRWAAITSIAAKIGLSSLEKPWRSRMLCIRIFLPYLSLDHLPYDDASARQMLALYLHRGVSYFAP